MSTQYDEPGQDVSDWWRTEIIDMEPGKIAFRGHRIEDLIGHVSLPQMIWLMLRGDRPHAAQARLFEAALVSAVDHGPQAPSIAASVGFGQASTAFKAAAIVLPAAFALALVA